MTFKFDQLHGHSKAKIGLEFFDSCSSECLWVPSDKRHTHRLSQESQSGAFAFEFAKYLHQMGQTRVAQLLAGSCYVFAVLHPISLSA